MAKTRMVKTDQRRSRKVASWPIEVRYFWILLWGYADDHGKGVDDPLLIKSDCFPLDRDITDEHVEAWMTLLHAAGVIARYEVNGTPYFFIVNWKEHQKPPHPTADVLPGPEHEAACARVVHEDRSGLLPKVPTGLGLGLGLSWVGIESRSGGGAAVPAAATTPPLFCSSHPNGTTGRCGPCGDARRIREDWDRQHKNEPDTPPPPPRSSAWKPGLCHAHLQIEATCGACEQDRKHENSNVLQGRFGAGAA